MHVYNLVSRHYLSSGEKVEQLCLRCYCSSLLFCVLGRFLASMASILSCFPPFSFIPHTTINYFILSSHGLGKSREVVSRCLAPGFFMETPSPGSVSFTVHVYARLLP